MNNRLTKIKNWILSSFQFITVWLLVFTIVLILKQQKDIDSFKSQLNYLENNINSNISGKIDDVKRKLNDVENKLDDVENNLSSEIDDVRRTVIIWSN